MKRFIPILLMSSALTFTTFSIQAKTYKFAANISNSGVPGVLLQEFAENVKEQTEGRIAIRFFWNGALGGQTQYVQQIQSGVIDMGIVNSATLENLVPVMGVLNLPYIFPSDEDYASVMFNPELNNKLTSLVSEKKLNIIGFLSNSVRSIYTTNEVKTVEDLNGLKIRTSSSDTYMDMIRSFGAVPTPMDFSGVYPALQQGIIDGAEGGLAGLWESKFGEVTKFALRTEHSRLTDFMVTSPKFIKQVKPEDLKIIYSEFDLISEKSITMTAKNTRKSEILAQDNLGVKFTAIDKAPLIKRMRPMYKNIMLDDDKKTIIEKVLTIQNRQL